MQDSQVIAILNRFTQDQDLRDKITQVIKEVKGQGSKVHFDKIFPKFSSDPALKSHIKEVIQKAAAGHDLGAITGYHLADHAAAASARNTIAGHQAVVGHIASTPVIG